MPEMLYTNIEIPNPIYKRTYAVLAAIRGNTKVINIRDIYEIVTKFNFYKKVIYKKVLIPFFIEKHKKITFLHIDAETNIFDYLKTVNKPAVADIRLPKGNVCVVQNE